MSNALPDYTVPTNGHGDIRHIVGDFGPRELVAFTKAATPQSKSSLGLGGDMYEELGRSGLRHWGGFVFEEWLGELQQGRRAAEVYREMQDQDPIIGAVMYAITMLMRRVTWWCEPKGSQEAEWLWGVLNDMRTSWPDTISDIISVLGYGYSFEETVYKKRNGENRNPTKNSQFNDGQIALAGLPGRSQDSLWKWVFDDDGQIEGMIQNPPPDYLLRYIPVEKALHFRTTIFKNNPEGRSVLRNAYRCFDPETELLTENGWKPVADVTEVDSLATLNDMGVIEYHAPTELHSYDYDGEMVHITSRYLDQMVTPNHNLYVRSTKAGSPYRLVPADEAKKTYYFKITGEWLAPDVDEYEIPSYVDGNGKLWPKRRVPMDDWLRFLGIYLAEGHAYDSGRQRMVGVSQQIGEKADTIREWVEAIGFPVYEHYDRREERQKVVFEITRAQMFDLLAPLGKSTTKRVPSYVKNVSRRQIRLFLEAYHLGDGTMVNTTPVIATASDQMADDLMELGLKGGYTSRRYWHHQTGFAREDIGNNGIWFVSFGHERLNGHRGTNWKRVPYQGKVHCVTVPNHTVLARRNGKACWSGNSWYFARNLQNLEGIGMERDLAGLPMLHPPPGVDIWDSSDPAMAGMRALAQNVVSSIRRDEQEGVVLPDGWVLELLTTGGSRQMDIGAAISRYENRIATSVLADLVMMGQDKVGSYALAVTKKDLFAASLGAYLDIISSVINTQLVPRLWELNGFTMPRPSLAHGAVETVDLDTLGNYIQRLGQSGAPIDWDTVLPWSMNQAGMPEPKEGHDFSPRVVTRPGPDTPASDRLTNGPG